MEPLERAKQKKIRTKNATKKLFTLKCIEIAIFGIGKLFLLHIIFPLFSIRYAIYEILF